MLSLFGVKAIAVYAIILAVIIAVSANVSDKILEIPLFEVGGLWLKASRALMDRMLKLVTTIPDVSNPLTYIYGSLFAVAAYGYYLVFYKPLNRVRNLGDVGYIADGSMSVKETANWVQKRRKIGDVPPVYPNGWFGVIESFRLKKGESTAISILGLNLALFRDEYGTPHILDAYCPHMGAHLAAGGRVKGDCLECPFHAWRFRGSDGKCTSIPYTDKIPDIAKVKSWPVHEVNGWIHVWHHAEDAEPYWTLPEIEEVMDRTWAYRGRSEHIVNAHIEEIPENGADVVHLDQVHGPGMFAGIDLRFMWSKSFAFAQHLWTANWEALPEPDGHIGSISLTHKMTLFGHKMSLLDLSVSAQQIGPGVVYLKFHSWFGKGVYIQALTPIAPMVQRVVHNIYIHWAVPIWIAKFFMLGEAIQVERDVMIWNNKQYEGKPMFVKSKEDSLIARHRRWYSQFYSENSPRINFKKEGLDF